MFTLKKSFYFYCKSFITFATFILLYTYLITYSQITLDLVNLSPSTTTVLENIIRFVIALFFSLFVSTLIMSVMSSGDKTIEKMKMHRVFNRKNVKLKWDDFQFHEDMKKIFEKENQMIFVTLSDFKDGKPVYKITVHTNNSDENLSEEIIQSFKTMFFERFSEEPGSIQLDMNISNMY